MKLFYKIAVLLCVFAGAIRPVPAQEAVPPPMPAYQPLSAAQLDPLLGSIALYPDPLVALILPASTLPTEIVMADRYVSGGGDPNQIEQQSWAPSVQGLARYPDVLKWMDDNLDWTTELGQAFLNQQQDVMNSIQRLRMSAYNLGNLQSTPQQQVINEGGYVEIVPVDTQEIYVPVYQPDQVYYQTPYGSPFITFGAGFAIGPWLDCDFDWGRHNLIVWGRDHPRPANWWREPARQRDAGHPTVWRPENRPGAVAVNRGDRGWGSPVVTRATPVVRRQEPVPQRDLQANDIHVNNASRPMPAGRPAPAPVEHSQPVSRPESTGAFIGIQSSSETRNYSNRGQQSMQTATHSAPVSRPAPVSHPAPAMPSGGGGGGGHGPGSQPRH
jgi:hypothetical protein